MTAREIAAGTDSDELLDDVVDREAVTVVGDRGTENGLGDAEDDDDEDPVVVAGSAEEVDAEAKRWLR